MKLIKSNLFLILAVAFFITAYIIDNNYLWIITGFTMTVLIFYLIFRFIPRAWYIAFVFFFVLVYMFCSDSRDAVDFKHKWFGVKAENCNYFDAHCWTKKFIDNDPQKEQRYLKVISLKITIPSWFIWRHGDLWHTAKFIQFLVFGLIQSLFITWFAESSYNFLFYTCRIEKIIRYIYYHKLYFNLCYNAVWMLLSYSYHVIWYGHFMTK